jgi:hypothetical protein
MGNWSSCGCLSRRVCSGSSLDFVVAMAGPVEIRKGRMKWSQCDRE